MVRLKQRRNGIQSEKTLYEDKEKLQDSPRCFPIVNSNPLDTHPSETTHSRQTWVTHPIYVLDNTNTISTVKIPRVHDAATIKKTPSTHYSVALHTLQLMHTHHNALWSVALTGGWMCMSIFSFHPKNINTVDLGKLNYLRTPNLDEEKHSLGSMNNSPAEPKTIFDPFDHLPSQKLM